MTKNLRSIILTREKLKKLFMKSEKPNYAENYT